MVKIEQKRILNSTHDSSIFLFFLLNTSFFLNFFCSGSCITTKHGNVNTDFILFIASGAFHSSKPSDLLAELQVQHCVLCDVILLLVHSHGHACKSTSVISFQ